MTGKIIQTDADGLSAMVRRGRGNADVFTRLHYLNHDEYRKERHFLALDRGVIVAAVGLQTSPYEPAVDWIKHVSVDEAHRHRGHATRLLHAVFADAVQNNRTLHPSSFSEMGERYIEPVMRRICTQYPGLEIRGF